ncbi:unnamed protein product, partial [Mesorhabditis belari]|uniref:Protein kinase domain-containing protein n=1 Tax=Mesorhabditis belari TaxID=2138241 RepID=A0AAF3F1H7_9BILA
MKNDDELDPCLPTPNTVYKSRLSMYRIKTLLGKGGYGAVFEAVRISDNTRVAIKCELNAVRKKLLYLEVKVLKAAQKLGMTRFCRIFDHGIINDQLSFLVMTLIGTNLWDNRMSRPKHHFSTSTALQMAEQTLLCIEQLHRLGFLHRDVKPGNFGLGHDEKTKHTLYVLDFGLCRRYTDRELRRPRQRPSYRGTTRYASVAALSLVEQSRKDDLESWLYMIIEWSSGKLPWRNDRDKKEVIRQKMELRSEESIRNKVLNICPREQYTTIMRYLDELTYVDVPDYEYIQGIIKDSYTVYGFSPNTPLDWDTDQEFNPPQDVIGTGRPIYFDQMKSTHPSGKKEKGNTKDTVIDKLREGTCPSGTK